MFGAKLMLARNGPGLQPQIEQRFDVSSTIWGVLPNLTVQRDAAPDCPVR